MAGSVWDEVLDTEHAVVVRTYIEHWPRKGRPPEKVLIIVVEPDEETRHRCPQCGQRGRPVETDVVRWRTLDVHGKRSFLESALPRSRHKSPPRGMMTGSPVRSRSSRRGRRRTCHGPAPRRSCGSPGRLADATNRSLAPWVAVLLLAERSEWVSRFDPQPARQVAWTDVGLRQHRSGRLAVTLSGPLCGSLSHRAGVQRGQGRCGTWAGPLWPARWSIERPWPARWSIEPARRAARIGVGLRQHRSTGLGPRSESIRSLSRQPDQ